MAGSSDLTIPTIVDVISNKSKLSQDKPSRSLYSLIWPSSDFSKRIEAVFVEITISLVLILSFLPITKS